MLSDILDVPLGPSEISSIPLLLLYPAAAAASRDNRSTLPKMSPMKQLLSQNCPKEWWARWLAPAIMDGTIGGATRLATGGGGACPIAFTAVCAAWYCCNCWMVAKGAKLHRQHKNPQKGVWAGVAWAGDRRVGEEACLMWFLAP